MSKETVEERLERLEKLVAEIVRERSSEQPRAKYWRKTIGMFDGDPIMKEVIEGALQAREEERARFYEEFDQQNGKS